MNAAATLTPQQLAEACADAMWNDDRASQALDMKIEHIAPGQATIAMTITTAMTNGHDTCHGGYIFTLADSAFAFACNGYNQRTVAQQASITYLAPAFAGNRLTARAVEVARQGRNGIYDVRVTDEEGRHIAEFRGHSRAINGAHLPE